MSGTTPTPNVEEGMNSNLKKVKMFDHISELPVLPDCILSYILTKLSMKDLLKTSCILSKKWCKLWTLRRDLCFDIFNVFENNEEELLQKGYLFYIPSPNSSIVMRHINYEICLDQFVRWVDQFLEHSNATIIDSFLVNFYLDSQQQTTIDKWMSFVIKRRIQRIDLLFNGNPHVHRDRLRNYYKFSFNLFSKTNASTLKHLRLESCIISIPPNCNFIPFKNLSFVSLTWVKVDETFIQSLPRLEELHLLNCELKSSIPKIVSSSLCHLKVMSCYVLFGDSMNFIEQYSLDCLKLTSLEYDGSDLANLNFNIPMLKNLQLAVPYTQQLNAFRFLATLPKLEILQLDIYPIVSASLKITQPLEHLKELNLILIWPLDFLPRLESGLSGILTILQASPLLQKLSVMITYPEIIEDQKVIVRDFEAFSHDEVKVIELSGCVGNWYEIDFVMNVMKYTNKLERIVLSPYWRDEIESVDWRSDPVCFQNGRQRTAEKFLSGDVVGQEKLVFL